MRLAPAGAAALTSAQVGAAIVASRWVIGEVGVTPLAFLRYALAATCLLPLLMISGGRVRTADLLPIALLGIAQFGVVIVLLNIGIDVLPAARAAVLFSTTPLITMVLETYVDGRPFRGTRFLATLLAIAGVATAVNETPADLGGGVWLGDAAVLGSALCAALCTVLYRPYLERNSALGVGAVAMGASAAALAIAAASSGWTIEAASYGPSTWAFLIAIGASSAAGYCLWLWALARERATEVAMFLGLSPITASALGALLLREEVSLGLLAAIVLVVLGLCLAYRGDGLG